MSLGKCRCVRAPMGKCGLEGYSEGDTYFFQHMEKDRNGKPYYRVWPVADDDYYETCGPTTFKRHFEEVK